MNLFSRSPLAYDKAIEWATRKKPARRSIPNETRMNNSMCSIENEGREFEKRAGFALMAVLAWQEKNNDLSDEKYKQFFPIIIREATDDRNFVKKAVNWALRQIGKSRPSLRQPAIDCAKEILKVYSEQSRGAKWIANDAIRELTNLKK
ncbi:MAG: hypothetical protein ACD_58C00021G0001 [uncultured bacterium]|nr:MAG: hypothetical protein ACD_58C00021G0001 [uncultured bacterium]